MYVTAADGRTPAYGFALAAVACAVGAQLLLRRSDFTGGVWLPAPRRAEDREPSRA
ncbi:hypothetical protein [Streptomyces somaliensis]|uniref:hypothetical protein n=1 Tax=Streptomyces somaliensis TaxID=78355 RepID=UPI0034E93C45|nr:hypothetical protein [Streptomyces somaliensis]